MQHPDQADYYKFTRRSRFDKAIHTLEGILKGISVDGLINSFEFQELSNWCQDQQNTFSDHRFVEILPIVQAALADGQISEDEKDDILFVCGNCKFDSVYYKETTNDIQVLHGMLHGILADGVISDEEAKGLYSWLQDVCEPQKQYYPYGELESVLTGVLRDGHVDDKEQSSLKEFFEDFISYFESRQTDLDIEIGYARSQMRLPAVCAVCPEIVFDRRSFCFTGISNKANRSVLVDHVMERGGIFQKGVTQKLNYLVVCADKNSCWAYECYGRKVEQAVKYRKAGMKLLIVHENDFWDAVQDS